MTLVNTALDRTFDVLLRPVGLLSPLAGLAVLSLATAVGMLLIVRATSNQRALADVKRRIHAGLFEIRLFNDDLRAILRAQAEILRHNLTYLRLSLVPMLWMIVPFVLVIAQLQFYYGYGALDPGQPVLVTAQLKTGGTAGETIQGDRQVANLDVPHGVRIDTPALWFPAPKQVVWRIAGETPGEYELRLTVGGETFSKTLHIADGIARRSPIRVESGFVNELLYPSEAPLAAAAPVESIAVAYPERDIDVFGWQIHWIVVYFVLSMAFALMLKKPLHVTF